MIPYSLLLYLSFTWVAMAPMNIAEWIFILLLIVDGVRHKRRIHLGATEQTYLKVTLIMSGLFLLSVLVYWVYPLEISGRVASSQALRSVLKQLYFFLPLLIVSGLRLIPAERFKYLCLIAVGVFGLLSVIAIQQYWTGFPIPHLIPDLGGRYHAIGFLGHHLSLASIWIFPTFFILDYSRLSSLSRQLRVSLMIVATLGFVAMFLSHSRMAWIATTIGVALYSLAVLKTWKARITVLGVYGVLGVGLIQLPVVQTRIHQSMGVSDRMELWRVHFELFQLRPFTGVGFLQSEEYSGLIQIAQGVVNVFSGHAHNVLLEILSSSGVLGLMGFLVWVSFICIQFLRSRKIPGLMGLGIAWIVFLLNGVTQVNFLEGKVMHQMAWCIAVLLFLSNVSGGLNEKTPR